MQLAHRLSQVAPSATLTLAQRAQEMAAAGQSVIGLTAGEPDFPTPAHIIDAMKRSLDAGRTRYTAVAGIPELKEAIRGKYQRRGLSFAADQVVVTTGAKQPCTTA